MLPDVENDLVVLKVEVLACHVYLFHRQIIKALKKSDRFSGDFDEIIALNVEWVVVHAVF